ncbi:ATP-binding protein [Enterobacter cloacae complex sp. 301C7]|uniref:ATP-binding protein n=1 Tax=Enterobacter cloacae complex sp. 301C7 TaxID=3395848 RepID=UPI003CEF8BCE
MAVTPFLLLINGRQFCTEDNWFGHTLITGNVGTGKTVLQRLLSISMLHLGHVIVVIDPKNDADWRQSLMDEAAELGLPFYKFHPASLLLQCVLMSATLIPMFRTSPHAFLVWFRFRGS